MRYDALGIGGAPLSIIVLVCTSVGIFFSERTGKPVKQKIDKSEKADDVEEGTALITPSPSSAPATLMHGRLLENGAIYFKACVALLLLIELNDLMAPNAPILATPELAELIQSMPNSESTTGLRAEQLVAIRTCLLASWFAFFLLPSRKVSLSGISFSAGAIAYLLFGMAGRKHSPSSSAVIEMVCVGCLLLITLYTVCRRYRARGLNHGLVVGSSGKKEFENAKKLPLEERLELAREGPTLIFDGICNLCNGSMSWFQERCREDSPVWYMWAQHQDTHEFLDEVGITRQDILKSWAYIESGIVYRGSTAWLMALGNLRAPWCYLSAVGKLCPTFIRETVYNFVAANRYNALGHSEACQRPNPAMRARFLHNTAVRGEQDTEIPSSQRKRLLVIGCGPAGLIVEKKLANKRGGAFSVVVVEPKEYYEFTPGILRGMCDPSNMNDLTFKLEPVLCDDLGITFVQGVVTDLNSRQATVKRVHGGVLRRSGPDANRDDFLINSSEDMNTVRVDFDFCVVAAGSQYATSSLWKVQTNLKKETSLTSNSYSLEGRIEELSKEHARLKQLNERRSGCVSIMGAGLVGVELAGEIRHHFPDIRQVKLFDPMPTVLPPLADSAQTIATKWLQNHNVELVLGDNFSKESVAAAERDSDVVYRCVGVQTRAGFLPQEVLDERGQVRVNSAMQIVRDGPTNFGAGRIFAIGDCVAVEGAATPYVKDIYPAEAMAGVVVENIRRALIVQCIQTRPGILKEIKPLMVMNLCSLGPRDCIFTLNRWVIARGLPATFVKWMIQYTKMSDSRNEILGRIIWNLIPH
jgi:NADH dehydrogenase FAD-containing subunit/predicted DCC family thiol-disulfide oxidoreductase YuxK